MHARFVATEPEILVVINVREDRVFADGTMYDAGVVTEREPFSYANDIAPEHLATGRCQQAAFSSSDPVR